MRVLLDTCVLSELQKPNANPNVRRAINEIDNADLFISAISMGEIIQGIALKEDGKRKRDLQSWVAGIERSYAERILPLDLETLRIWGELLASGKKAGKPIPVLDGLIAATARRYGLHIMTCNVSDFEPTGALIINPWNEVKV